MNQKRAQNFVENNPFRQITIIILINIISSVGKTKTKCQFNESQFQVLPFNHTACVITLHVNLFTLVKYSDNRNVVSVIV